MNFKFFLAPPVHADASPYSTGLDRNNWKFIDTYSSGSSDVERFMDNFAYAKRLSNEDLKAKVNTLVSKNDLNSLPGYHYEAVLRKLPTKADGRFDVKGYHSQLKTVNKDLTRANIKTQWMNLGLLGGNILAGIGLMRMADTQPEEDVKQLVNQIKEKDQLSTTVSYTADKWEPHFNPETNSVLTTHNKATAAHELGHASNAKVYRKVFGDGAVAAQEVAYARASSLLPRPFRPISGPLNYIPIMAAPAAITLSDTAMNYIKGTDPSSLRYKAGNWAYENPDIVMGAAASPILIEEGTATARALSNIYKFAPEGKKMQELAKGGKTLGTAFATYLTLGAIPVTIGYLKKKHRQHKVDESKYKMPKM